MTTQTPQRPPGYLDGWNARSDDEAVRMAMLWMSDNRIHIAIAVLQGRSDRTLTNAS